MGLDAQPASPEKEVEHEVEVTHEVYEHLAEDRKVTLSRHHMPPDIKVGDRVYVHDKGRGMRLTAMISKIGNGPGSTVEDPGSHVDDVILSI